MIELKTNYKILAKICLHADGGYCRGCAYDVARGFCKAFKGVDIDKLKEAIDLEYEAWDWKNNGNFFPVIEVL